MKNLNINPFDEKKEEIADALISLGLGRPVARTLGYLNTGDEATTQMNWKKELACASLKSAL